MRIMRAQVDGRIQETDGLLRPARIPQRLTEPEIGLRMTGIEPDRGFELGHRKIELASKGMNTAEGKVPKRVPGIERDCAVRRDLGFGQGRFPTLGRAIPVLLDMDVGKSGVTGRGGRVELDRPFEMVRRDSVRSAGASGQVFLSDRRRDVSASLRAPRSYPVKSVQAR